MTTIDTSIIISTYNSPEWLAKVLHGYNNQTYRLFEIVIADDGSKQETRDLIEEIKDRQLEKEVLEELTDYEIEQIARERDIPTELSDFEPFEVFNQISDDDLIEFARGRGVDKKFILLEYNFLPIKQMICDLFGKNYLISNEELLDLFEELIEKENLKNKAQ